MFLTLFNKNQKEDIALFAEMGFKVFRTSINWTRIFPTGTVDFYTFSYYMSNCVSSDKSNQTGAKKLSFSKTFLLHRSCLFAKINPIILHAESGGTYHDDQSGKRRQQTDGGVGGPP